MGLILLIAGNAVIPYFYEAYQDGRIRDCKNDHPVAADAWNPIFDFDMGGSYILGDSAQDRALIECIVGSLRVRHTSEPLYGKGGGNYPMLWIISSAFERGYDLTYYSGSRS